MSLQFAAGSWDKGRLGDLAKATIDLAAEAIQRGESPGLSDTTLKLARELAEISNTISERLEFASANKDSLLPERVAEIRAETYRDAAQQRELAAPFLQSLHAEPDMLKAIAERAENNREGIPALRDAVNDSLAERGIEERISMLDANNMLSAARKGSSTILELSGEPVSISASDSLGAAGASPNEAGNTKSQQGIQAKADPGAGKAFER